jgi:hypothetical protein
MLLFMIVNFCTPAGLQGQQGIFEVLFAAGTKQFKLER